ncbi:MAG: PepSY domain-containing protein [Rudanella sp.]|nr:PepSY domain-containing protein [Rudanella sp.]
MNRNWHLRIRKTHRYLGLFIGIQFLLWTVGGLYFSWSNLDDIHGDPLKRPATGFPASLSLVSPSVPLQALRQKGVGSVLSISLIEVLNQPLYQLSYRIQHGTGHAMTHTQLADAKTGQLRGELTQAEATGLAQQRFAGSSAVERVEYLTNANGHHEYRAKPLPAYAVTFRQPAHATVYVAAQLGTVQSVRTDPWRIFDTLWMLHTMDYEGRDDFNNWLLRAFSVLGLLTVASGFTLYFVSSSRFRRKPKRGQRSMITQI